AQKSFTGEIGLAPGLASDVVDQCLVALPSTVPARVVDIHQISLAIEEAARAVAESLRRIGPKPVPNAVADRHRPGAVEQPKIILTNDEVRAADAAYCIRANRAAVTAGDQGEAPGVGSANKGADPQRAG